MARLIRKKCARSLIAVKAGSVPARGGKGVVLISVVPAKVAKADAVKVGLVQAVVKTHADPAKADAVKVGLVQADVKTHADPVPVDVITHADPAKAIEISLALNAMMPKVY